MSVGLYHAALACISKLHFRQSDVHRQPVKHHACKREIQDMTQVLILSSTFTVIQSPHTSTVSNDFSLATDGQGCELQMT